MIGIHLNVKIMDFYNNIADWMLPIANEYILKPCLGFVYNEVWNYIKKKWFRRDSQRYQNAMAKKRGGLEPLFFLFVNISNPPTTHDFLVVVRY